MAKFINKKEQVYDIRLTSYGRYLISIGDFTPSYYAFYDDNILYDSNYAGFPEQQNHTEKRIKEETQYLEGLVLFEDVDNMTDTEELIDFENIEITPTKQKPRLDVFRFTEPIGDAFLDGETQSAPAWKIIVLNGLISSSFHEDLINNSKIPQINIDLNYKKVVYDYEIDPNNARNTLEDPKDVFDVINSTSTFVDNKVIKLRTDNVLIYADEVNTELLNENFDIEIFEIEELPCVKATAQLYLDFSTGGALTDNDTITIDDGAISVTFTWKTTPDSADDTEIEIPNPENAREALENLRAGIENASKLDLTLSAVVYRTTSTLTTRTYDIATLTMTNNKCGTKGNTEIVYVVDGKIDLGILWSESATSFINGADADQKLHKRYFQKEEPQVQNDFLVANEPVTNLVENYTTASVEYYFSVLTDFQVPPEEACKAAELYNKDSYYIDLDFDCTIKDENIFFDIYGIATEPDICQS